MRLVIAFALVLLAAPVAAATETDDEVRDAEKVQPSVTEVATDTEAEMQLAPVVIEDRAPAEETAVQEMPRRGSFWWIVGAIVVAGLILAVIL